MSLPEVVADQLSISGNATVADAARLLLKNEIENLHIKGKSGEFIGILNRTELMKVILLGLPSSTMVKDLLQIFMQDAGSNNKIENSSPDFSLYQEMYQKDQMQACFDSMHNGIIVIDIKGKIQFINKAAQLQLGSNINDYKGQNIAEFLSNSRKKDDKFMEEMQTATKVFACGKELVYNSVKMRELINLVKRIAAVDSTVLIQGESGVGKELVADLLYSNSSRKNGPFIKVNCGAIPENLLESELFGYEAGAFTGASKNGKAGLFELAEGGILFLDEIGDMPLNLQVKLLRAIQDMQISRVGGIKPIKMNIRILAGTNRNLHDMVEKGNFREDLFYRLNVVPIYVPPLRERKEDIPALSNYFLKNFNHKYQMNKKLTADVMTCFINYQWPGNVRELENLIERLIITTSHDYINLGDLPLWLNQTRCHKDKPPVVSLRNAVEKTEKKVLEDAFTLYKSTYEVARVLEVNQSTIVRKAAKYGIKRR